MEESRPPDGTGLSAPLVGLRARVLEGILRAGRDLPGALEALVREVEGLHPGLRCSVLLVGPDGKHLVSGAAPSLPEEYNAAVNGLEIGPEVGCCGAAAHRKQRIIAEDIGQSPLWAAFRDFTLSHGLRACWSQPILNEHDEVLGTFAMYYGEPRQPSETEIETIETAARLAAIAIEHAQTKGALRQLIDAVPDALVAHCEGVIVFCNPAAERLFGAEGGEGLVGRPAMDFVAPESREMVKARLRRSPCEPLPPAEEWLLRVDGGRFPARVHTIPITWRGKPAAEVIVHDLSAERESEIRMRRLRAAVEQASEGIFIADDAGRLVWANAAFLRPLGLDASALGHVNLAELMERHMGETSRRAMMEAFRAGRGWEGECELEVGGQRRHYLRRITPLMEDGGRYWVGVSFDITARREQQARLQHAQRLESLGVLAGGIAHDFNNILAAIMGNATLARMKAPPDAAMREHLKKIEASCRRAGALCGQMLAYAGKSTRAPKQMNVNAAVREISGIIEVSLGKQVELETRLGDGLPAIEADEAQLEQVVLNLITNANEAIGERPGRITVATGLMRAEAAYLAECLTGAGRPPGDYVFIEVRDDGCGMDEETRSRIFDPFFTTKRTGRGLGMSALLGIVDQHHGAIHLQTAPGEGSTFRILFPAAGPAAREDAPPACETASRFAGKALVADDEDLLRETLVEMLRQEGFDVVDAADGEEAVRRFHESDDLSLVIMDVSMPRMNGREACREIRASRPDVPVILASGHDETDVCDGCDDDCRPAAFLHKPFSIEHLREALRRALEQRS